MQKEMVRVGERRVESKERGERGRSGESGGEESRGDKTLHRGIDSRRLRSKESMQ